MSEKVWFRVLQEHISILAKKISRLTQGSYSTPHNFKTYDIKKDIFEFKKINSLDCGWPRWFSVPSCQKIMIVDLCNNSFPKCLFKQNVKTSKLGIFQKSCWGWHRKYPSIHQNLRLSRLVSIGKYVANQWLSSSEPKWGVFDLANDWWIFFNHLKSSLS